MGIYRPVGPCAFHVDTDLFQVVESWQAVNQSARKLEVSLIDPQNIG